MPCGEYHRRSALRRILVRSFGQYLARQIKSNKFYYCQIVKKTLKQWPPGLNHAGAILNSQNKINDGETGT